MPGRISIALLLVASLVGCDRVGGESGRGEARPVVAPPKLSPVELLPPTVERSVTQRVVVRNPAALAAIQLDEFKQADGVVDILWVIDDSGSMKDERARLSGNFARFYGLLQSMKVRFHMAVISANYEDGAGAMRGNPRVLDNNTPDAGMVFVNNTTFPNSRIHWEQGLRLMQLALSPPLTNPGGPNEGFLRTNAALAVIVVSDKDDHSFGDPAFYGRWLRGVKGSGNENLTSFSTIAGTTPDGCYGPGEQKYFDSLAEPSFRYSAVSAKTGGIIGSVCSTSFEDTLTQIAAALNTLRRVFPLSLKPDPATISVLVDGTAIAQDVVGGWQYRADTQSITFLGSYVPPPASLIKIQYAISP